MDIDKYLIALTRRMAMHSISDKNNRQVFRDEEVVNDIVAEAHASGPATIHTDEDGVYRQNTNGLVERLFLPEIMIDMSDTAQKAFIHFDPPRPLPAIKEQPWVALLVDGDGLKLDVQINQVIQQCKKLGEVVVARIYGNYDIGRFSAWERIYKKYGFERRIYLGVHKNIADFGIVTEATELALCQPEIDFFVLVSNDGGFFPLMAKMSQLGKRIYWIGGQAPLKKAERLREEVEMERYKVKEQIKGL